MPERSNKGVNHIGVVEAAAKVPLQSNQKVSVTRSICSKGPLGLS